MQKIPFYKYTVQCFHLKLSLTFWVIATRTIRFVSIRWNSHSPTGHHSLHELPRNWFLPLNRVIFMCTDSLFLFREWPKFFPQKRRASSGISFNLLGPHSEEFQKDISYFFYAFSHRDIVKTCATKFLVPLVTLFHTNHPFIFKIIFVTHKGNWNIVWLRENSICGFARLPITMDINEKLEPCALIKAASVSDVIKKNISICPLDIVLTRSRIIRLKVDQLLIIK